MDVAELGTTVIDEEYEEYLRTNIERDIKLLEFVEDFLLSEEYFLMQVQESCEDDEGTTSTTISMCVCIECWTEGKNVKLSKAALVKRAQKLWAIERRFEDYVQNQATRNILQHQEKSITTIRQKIKEAKKKYTCHKDERGLLKEKEREEVLEDLKTKYRLDTKYLKTKSKPVEKVLVYNKIRIVQRKKKKLRMIAIVNKILMEYKRQRQVEDLKNKRYDTKVTRREKILKGAELVGTAMILSPRSESKPEEIVDVEEEKKEAEDVPAAEPPKADREKKKEKGKDQKGKADDKKGKDKASKKEKDKKGKQDKKEKKGKEDKKGKKGKREQEVVQDLVLPYVPITNERLKIKPDENQNMMDLIPKFAELDQLICDRETYNREKELMEGIFYPSDTDFSWRPKVLKFQGFKNGIIYKKKLNILNGGSVEKKCRFYFVKLEEFDPTLIQVEPVGAQHVIPGFSFNITVTFKPTVSEKAVKGSIFFLTYRSCTNEYLQLSVPLICIPYCCNVTIVPEIITFATLPVWEAKKIAAYNNYKTLKISNTGRKPCKIVITKVRDAFQMDDLLADLGKEECELFITENQGIEIDDQFQFEESDEYELLVPLEETDTIVKDTLQLCIDDVFSSFTFKYYCFDVSANSDRKVRVYFRNVDYVGNYCSKYLVSVFEHSNDGVLSCVGSQEITVQAETTGPFIEVRPEILDFDVCVFDSVYQLCLTIHNNASIAHGIGVKFPSVLKSYLSASENDVYIQPNGSKKISIRFIPRKQITIKDKVKYYNPETNILEFPIYVHVMSKSFANVPPIKVQIYAILSDPNGLSIKPVQWKHTSYFNEFCEVGLGQCTCELTADYVIDIGECTIAETVYTELELTNNSYVFQIYGFLDLPECIKIIPNYGFGEILPMGIKKLMLAFSPEPKDIPNYAMECQEANNTITFRISVDTIKNVGRMTKPAKPFTYKSIRRSLEITEEELEKEFPPRLVQDMYVCLDLLQDEDVLESLMVENIQACEDGSAELGNGEDLLESHLDRSLVSEEMCAEEETLELNIKSNKLWIRATIVDPLCDISHQYIEFPDTPCGSFSLMTIYLRALTKLSDFECTCGYSKKFSKCKKDLEFSAHYEIVNDNPQISIEPICGELTSGQTVKLTLVAQPQLSEEAVRKTAREVKIEQLLQRKCQEWEIKRQKELAAKLAKAEKDKAKKGDKEKGKDKKSKPDPKGKKRKPAKAAEAKPPPEPEPEPIPKFVIEEDEIVVDYLDLYPAEMVAFKNLEPYFIETRFCCTITYSSNDFSRKPDKLYFTALCKVIKPDFIHNMNTQHIDFGPTVSGMVSRKIISIQNIQHEPISPTVTLLSPTGFFTCPSPKNLKLPSEHILQLPVTFAPSEAMEATEYFEIRAGSTVCPFIVSGEGVERSFTISPEFVVCRLQAKSGAFADCALEVNNQCEAPLAINFVKTCELEGEIKAIVEETPTQKGKAKKEKPGKGNKKPKKISKFSQDLTKEEEVSLENYFKTKTGESYFELLGATNGEVLVDKTSKKSIKVRFGIPLPPQEKRAKGAKKQKPKPKPKGKSPKSSSTGSNKYYVAKYNIMLGNSTFLRDAIFIANFI